MSLRLPEQLHRYFKMFIYLCCVSAQKFNSIEFNTIEVFILKVGPGAYLSAK